MTTHLFKDNIVLQHLKATPFQLWMETDELHLHTELNLLKEELYIANMTHTPMRDKIQIQLQISFLSNLSSSWDEWKQKNIRNKNTLYAMSCA